MGSSYQKSKMSLKMFQGVILEALTFERLCPPELLQDPCFLWCTGKSTVASSHLRQKICGKSGLKSKSQIVLKILVLWSPDDGTQAFHKPLSIATVWSWFVIFFSAPKHIRHLIKAVKVGHFDSAAPWCPLKERRMHGCTSSPFVCHW